MLSRGQAILKSGMATPVGISFLSLSFLDTWWVSSGSHGTNGLNLFVLLVLLRWLKPRLEGGGPLLINSPTGAKWVGQFLKRTNKFGRGVPVEAPLGERICTGYVSQWWDLFGFLSYLKIGQTHWIVKKDKCARDLPMPKVQRERTGCWRTRAMRRLRWNFVVDKRQGHGRSGLVWSVR